MSMNGFHSFDILGVMRVLKHTESERGWVGVMVKRQHKKGRGFKE